MAPSSLRESFLPASQRDTSWKFIFMTNVFFGCISFSIVMPNLWLYLHSMHVSKAFYAGVVASFSVGEALGAIAVGSLSNNIGTKSSLKLCSCLGMTGASSYALAKLVYVGLSRDVAPFVVLGGRLLQGISAGGRQAVEQAYISVAAPPEQITELTGMLSTIACLGFIFGPAFGAAVGLLHPFHIGPLAFNNFTLAGWFCALLDLLILVNLSFRFNEIKPEAREGSTPSKKGSGGGGGRSDPSGAPSDRTLTGVWACIAFFFVHFNGFAVQERPRVPACSSVRGRARTGCVSHAIPRFVRSPEFGVQAVRRRIMDRTCSTLRRRPSRPLW